MIGTNQGADMTLAQWLRDKAERTEDIGDATDFKHAAEVIDDLYEALKSLSFAAQTSGGTAGRDEALCAAVDRAEAALAKARGES